MANVYDVAAYILSKRGGMTAMKLQKLVYYSQAWSLVWDNARLFPERIEAWANGPVSPALYRLHAGDYMVNRIVSGNPESLTRKERETVDAVLEYYGDKEPQWLIDLTHLEKPWRKARAGIPDGESSTNVISIASMAEYYGSL